MRPLLIPSKARSITLPMGAGKFSQDFNPTNDNGRDTQTSNYLAISFWSAAKGYKETVDSFGGHVEDRLFILTVPVLKTTSSPQAENNNLVLKFLGFSVYNSCFIAHESVCKKKFRDPGGRRQLSAVAKEASDALLKEVFQPITFTKNVYNKQKTFFAVEFPIVTPVPGVTFIFGFFCAGSFNVDLEIGIDFMNLQVTAALTSTFGVTAGAYVGLSFFGFVACGLQMTATVMSIELPVTGNVILQQPTLAPKACILAEMTIYPLILTLDFWWDLKLCPKVDICWVRVFRARIPYPCNFRIVFCGRKTMNLFTWSADPFTTTLFEKCWVKEVPDTTPPYGGEVSIVQFIQDLVVNFKGVTDDESKLMFAKITLLQFPARTVLHTATVSASDTMYKVPPNALSKIPLGTALMAEVTYSNTAGLTHTISSAINAFGKLAKENILYFDPQKPRVVMLDTTSFGGQKRLSPGMNLVFSASNEFNLAFEVSQGIEHKCRF